MKISEAFGESDSMCREMLWNSGLVRLIVEKVVKKKATLKGKTTVETQLVFRGVKPTLVTKGGKLKFLVRHFEGSDTTEWHGRQLGLYVDKSYVDRDGSGGTGSIQFAIGPDFWTKGNYSGKEPPPALPTEQKQAEPPPAESVNQATGEVTTGREPGEEG